MGCAIWGYSEIWGVRYGGTVRYGVCNMGGTVRYGTYFVRGVGLKAPA